MLKMFMALTIMLEKAKLEAKRNVIAAQIREVYDLEEGEELKVSTYSMDENDWEFYNDGNEEFVEDFKVTYTGNHSVYTWTMNKLLDMYGTEYTICENGEMEFNGYRYDKWEVVNFLTWKYNANMW